MGYKEDYMRILIVDDDLTTTLSLKNYLGRHGFSVITANSAITGAELMKKENF